MRWREVQSLYCILRFPSRSASPKSLFSDFQENAARKQTLALATAYPAWKMRCRSSGCRARVQPCQPRSQGHWLRLVKCCSTWGVCGILLPRQSVTEFPKRARAGLSPPGSERHVTHKRPGVTCCRLRPFHSARRNCIQRGTSRVSPLTRCRASVKVVASIPSLPRFLVLCRGGRPEVCAPPRGLSHKVSRKMMSLGKPGNLGMRRSGGRR